MHRICLLLILIGVVLLCALLWYFLMKKSQYIYTRKNTDSKSQYIYTRQNTDSKSQYIYNRKNTDSKLKGMATQVLGDSFTPIYIIDDFLTPSECASIITSVGDNLVPSPLTRYDPTLPNFRTSRTAYFDNKGIQGHVNQKILNLMDIDDKYAEIPQLQHYKVGGQFKSHWDWFDPVADKKFYDNGQRTWTVMVYLNDVEEGGKTFFDYLDVGISPRRGRVVIWSNLSLNGEVDKRTKHQGSPVIKGEKYIITKWFKFPAI